MTTPAILMVAKRRADNWNTGPALADIKNDVRKHTNCTVIRTVYITEARVDTALRGVRWMVDNMHGDGRYGDQEIAVVVADESVLFGREPDMFSAPDIRFLNLAQARETAARA